MTRTITISQKASDTGPQTLKTTTISHGPKNKNHLKMWLSSFPLGIDPKARQDFFRRIQFPERIGNKFFRHRSETDNHNFTCPGQSQFHMEPAKLLWVLKQHLLVLTEWYCFNSEPIAILPVPCEIVIVRGM